MKFAYIPSVAVRLCLSVMLECLISSYRCNKTSFAPALAFVTSTFVAQIVLTLRWEQCLDDLPPTPSVAGS